MLGPYDVLSGCIGFDWDGDNSEKNWQKHRVSVVECEHLSCR